MSEKTVLWEVADGVGRITLNRPETLNAWIAEFGAELRDIVTGPAAEADVRAVLVTGAGVPDGVARHAGAGRAGAPVGARQLGAPGRPADAGGRVAGRAARPRAHAVLRGVEARFEQHALSEPRRAARPGGRDPARARA